MAGLEFGNATHCVLLFVGRVSLPAVFCVKVSLSYELRDWNPAIPQTASCYL